ncbi:small multi-drug export protein [Mesobacillus foraminis]|uniref:COG2426 family protein n=1 Tax=Mesobacillus foraminis TaxID=279826 RepID=UPI0039A261E8
MEGFKLTVQEFLIQHADFLPPEVIVVILSALPIIELRGGLPAGTFLGLSFQSALFFSVLGNLLPIFPILFLFQPISTWMMRFSAYERVHNWLYERTMSKSSQVKKYGALGLILFTAVPLPTTGAYSACLASIIFGIPIRWAFISISIGVLIASIVIGLLTYPLF